MEIVIHENITGSILDIGGGGECVIGRIYGDSVIAIDNSQEELDEAPDCCKKMLMDASELSFPDNSFDNVTFFYSLMYMSYDTQKDAIREALRVLKSGGMLYIWDTNIHSAYPEPFIVDLDIVSERVRIHTSYGIVKDEVQDKETFLRYLADVGQGATVVSDSDGRFLICCKKE
ncbi:MAG: class I SAM-dependent methyltransferase [Acutalibacteraceae bacterium]